MSEQARPPLSLPPTIRGEVTAPAAGYAMPDRVTPTDLIAPVQADDLRLTSADLRRLTSEPRYSPGRVLGRGGIGEVHLARDGRIGRDVAMKTIRSEHQQDSELTLRMLREAVLQGQLDHPAIVPVYDLGLGPEGLFFTMRRVQGVTLAEVLGWLGAGEELARQRFGLGRLLGIFVTMCRAIDYAHQRGVLHRDLKPGNVMLGDFGEIYVLDWGAARVLDEGDDWERRKLSSKHQGIGIGTPGYMAPEQVAGEEPDARTDIYALGSVLFEMLTFERLHQGTAMQRLQSTLRPPDAPSSRRADVPPALDAICRRATALERDGRHASARELADAIESFLDSARDDAMRTQLADEAARAAGAAASAGPSGRGEALRQATSALALQPDNDEAMRLIERLLDTTPEELPTEAERAFAERREQHLPTRLFAIVRLAITLVLAAVLELSPGGPLWWRACTWLSLVLLAVGPLLLGLRAPAARLFSTPFLYLSLLAMLLCCGFLGPFMMGPTLLLLLGLAHISAQPRSERLIVAGCTVAALLPYPLQRLGLLPALDPPPEHLGAMAPAVTHLVLWAFRGTLVAAPLALWSRVHRRQLAAERHLFWQAWQLRQLGRTPPSSR